MLEYSDDFNSGTPGDPVTPANSIWDRIQNSGPELPVFVADGRNGTVGVSRQQRAGITGYSMLGRSLPGTTFDSVTDVSSNTVVDPISGRMTASIWFRAESAIPGGSTSILYLETHNPAAWADEEYVIDYTYSDYEAVTIATAVQGYHPYYEPQGAAPGDNVMIVTHGPAWNTDLYDETSTYQFCQIPLGEWAKYTIESEPDGTHRAIVANESGGVVLDSGWEGPPDNPSNPAPDGWRPAIIWTRVRNNYTNDSASRYTLDDFSLVVADAPAPPVGSDTSQRIRTYAGIY